MLVSVSARAMGMDSATTSETSSLRKTALNALHRRLGAKMVNFGGWDMPVERSEEHTSELQSRLHLVCRLLLEKNKMLMLICILPKNVITSCSVTMMLLLHFEVKPLMTLTTVLYLSCALISGHLASMLMSLTKRR